MAFLHGVFGYFLLAVSARCFCLLFLLSLMIACVSRFCMFFACFFGALASLLAFFLACGSVLEKNDKSGGAQKNKEMASPRKMLWK